jgi:hypothetical protein
MIYRPQPLFDKELDIGAMFLMRVIALSTKD